MQFEVGQLVRLVPDTLAMWASPRAMGQRNLGVVTAIRQIVDDEENLIGVKWLGVPDSTPFTLLYSAEELEILEEQNAKF
tara:strand:- start:145 stop:384 length:240 start_codon:yes stop_codon:yes gene_type:complete